MTCLRDVSSVARACSFAAASVLLVTLSGCRSSGGANGAEGSRVRVGAETRSTTAEEPLSAAKRLFFDAVAGEGGALPRATGLLEGLGGERSGDPRVMAYLGGCRLLAAPLAVLPWEKGRLSKEGCTLQDRAVAVAPEDLEIRAVRGLSNFQLPRFFGRADIAAADLALVAPRALEATRAGLLEPRVAAAVLYRRGLLLDGSGDRTAAEAAWRAAVEVGPDSPGGQAAARRLPAR